MWQNDPALRCGRSERSPPVSIPASMKTSAIAGLAALALAATGAAATDVTVIGLFPNMAVVTIDRGSAKTLKLGERTSEGVLLVSVGNGNAVLEIDGTRQTLEMGQHFETA